MHLDFYCKIVKMDKSTNIADTSDLAVILYNVRKARDDLGLERGSRFFSPSLYFFLIYDGDQPLYSY